MPLTPAFRAPGEGARVRRNQEERAMKVYGRPMSTCTRKVLTTLVETNTPYELVLVDLMKGDHKNPEHMARQPWGKVPALDDNGFRMHESRAICRYINDKVGGKLVPTDLRARAAMDQWTSIEHSYFTTPTMTFVFHHMFQRPQEAASLESAKKELEHSLPVLDAHLAKNAYFAGGDFSLADVTYMPYVEYGMATP